MVLKEGFSPWNQRWPVEQLHHGKNARILIKRWKALIIGRQPNLQSVNALGEFVDETDPSAVERKVDNPDTAVYILNDKLQVRFLANTARRFYDTMSVLNCHSIHPR